MGKIEKFNHQGDGLKIRTTSDAAASPVHD
jgi:hypothetical protein